MKMFLIVLGLVFGMPSLADATIGTVDMQKALRSVEAGKKAKEKLESIFNKKKEELQKEEASLKKTHADIQKQTSVLSEAALGKKQMEFNQKAAAFQEAAARSQMELQKKEQELTAPIIEKLRELVQAMAKKKGFTMVLEKNENTVLFSLEKDDFTDEVVKEFNKTNKGS